MRYVFLILLALVLVIFTVSYGQEVHYGREITVTWDETTQFQNGDPILPEHIVTYRVYLRITDQPNGFLKIELPESVLTMNHGEGLYVVGVSALVEYPDGVKRENPDITWSTMEDTARVPIPFLWDSYGVADVIRGLKILIQ